MRPDAVLLRRILGALIVIFAAGCSFSIAVAQTALYLALACWALLMVLNKKSEVPRTPLDFYFLAYLVVGASTMIFSGARGMPLIFVKRLLLLPIVYLVYANVRQRRSLSVLLVALSVTMVVLSLVGIQKYVSGPRGLEGRLELFHHYMTSGGILMFMGLMAFSFGVSSAPVRWRLTAWVTGLLVLACLIFTFTRSSWLGFLAGFLVMALFRSKKLILGLVLALAVLALLAPAPFKERAASIFNPLHRHNIQRVHMWRAGWEIMKSHPLTGVGDVDLAQWYEPYRPAGAAKHGHLHNNFVMFGATLGFPGLIFFLVLSVKILIMELKIARSIPGKEWLLKSTAVGGLASYVGFQVNGLFEWNFGDAEIAMLLWLTVGLTLCVDRMFRTQAENVLESSARS